MNTALNTKSGDESCSCTTCLKSESDDLTLMSVIDLGSRIDRLYLGKYIPLREQKLLQKLVRTRAVYDDLRAQLISDSSVSKSSKVDDSSRKEVSVRDLDATEKSSAVMGLVKLVDKCSIETKRLDTCCSCCSCSSKVKLHVRNFKRNRLKRPYTGRNGKSREKRRCNRQQAVQCKTKLIRSDPCTCTYKLLKKHSKYFNKGHLRPPLSLFDLQPTTDEELKQKRRRIEAVRKSKNNLIQSNIRMKDRISIGITSPRQQSRLQDKMEKNDIKYSQSLALDQGTISLNENDFLNTSKQNRRKNQIIKNWECKPECDEDLCLPEKCILKMKHKRLYRNNHHHKGINYNILTKRRTAGEPLRQINQTQKLSKIKMIETRKPVLLNKQTREINRISLNKHPKVKKIRNLEITDDKKNESILNIQSNIPRFGTSTENLEPSKYSRVEYRHKKPFKSKKIKKWDVQRQNSPIRLVKFLNETKTRGHALKRCYCSLKLKVKTSNSKKKDQGTKKVMIVEKSGTKIILNDAQMITDHKRMQARSMCTESNCWCSCDPHEYIQVARKANKIYSGFHVQKTKATPSITMKFNKHVKTQNVQSLNSQYRNASIDVIERKKSRQGDLSYTIHKQAVRVESTLSFNSKIIKFQNYAKDSAYGDQQIIPAETKSLLQPKYKTYQNMEIDDRGYKENVRRDTAMRVVKNKHNASTGFSFRRYCNTLKLQIKEVMRNCRLKFATSTKTAELKSIDTLSKATKTTSQYVRSFKPCDCKSFTCISGEIDPYIYLKRIAALNKRRIEVSSNTRRSKSASTFSAPHPEKFKSVQVQYKLRDKGKKVLLETRDPERIVYKFPSKTKSEASIKIGSTFSFNIELYKNKLPTEQNKLTYPTKKIINDSKTIKNLKMNKLNVAQVETHIQGPWKRKDSVTDSMLKRCISSFNLQKKRKQQYCKKETSSSKRLFFPTPRVYTVARVMVGDKRKSIKTGTPYPSYSMSTSESQLKPGNKKKHQTIIQESVKPHSEALENSQNQAVRISSSFSLDVVFSKKFSTSPNTGSIKYSSNVNDFENLRRQVSKSIKGNRKRSHNLQSQTALIKTGEKGSVTRQKRERCFCTLKLQKKGRLHKLQHQQTDILPHHLNNKGTMSTGRTTKTVKPFKLTYDIEPYECIPNICVPGQCDPYQCLEIMKNVNSYEVGTSTVINKTKSKSSFAKYNRRKNSNRSRAVNVKPEKYTNVAKYKDIYPEFASKKPLRKAVRLGSNFSFNVEFFKEQTSSSRLGEQAETDMQFKENKYSDSFSKLEKHTRKNKQSDFKSKKGGLKFLKKCCRFFKNPKRTTDSSTGYDKINNKKMSSRIMQTYEPYMCLPDICVPDNCDPHICSEIIRKYRKKDFKMSTADHTQSVYASTANIRRKNAKTLVKHKSKLNHKPNFNDYPHINDSNPVYLRPEKNVVRIGSKFNFDIEFYKQHRDNNNSIKPRTRNIKPMNYTENKSILKKNATTTLSPLLVPQSSQIKTQGRLNGMNNIIKRCFCTRNLDDFNKYKNKKIQNYDENFDTKGIMTENKLVKGSYGDNRDFGVSTPSSKKVTHYINTNTKKYKSKSQFTTSNDYHYGEKQPPHKYLNIGDTKQQKKQLVRICSSFTFNVEFSKDKIDGHKKNFDKNNPFANHTKNKIKHTTTNKQIRTDKNKRIKMKQNQLNSMGKAESTTMPPFRPLPEDILEVYGNNGTQTSTHARVMKSPAKMKIPRQFGQLHEFECEPFYCVPGECDPYECLKRIKMREKKFKTQTTFTHSPLSHKSVGVKQKNVKFQKSQTNYLYTHDRLDPDMSEIPRLKRNFNKQAVKIGSNINFSVEFSKNKNSPKTALTEPGFDRNIKSKNLYDYSDNGYIDHEARVHNKSRKKALKRCFCCLQFNNMSPAIPFHQTINVGRVSVQHNSKYLSQALNNKQAAAKLNKYKKLENYAYSNSGDNRCFCQVSDDNNLSTNEDLKTIKPYLPQKFDRTISTTILSPQNKSNKTNKSVLKNRGKNLTRKRANSYLNNIQTNEIQVKAKENKGKKRFFSLKNFIGCCTQLLHPRSTPNKLPVTENKTKINELIPLKIENVTRSNKKIVSNFKPKKYEKTYHANRIINLLHQSIYVKQDSKVKTVKVNTKKNKPLNVETNIKQKNNKKTGDNLSNVRYKKDVKQINQKRPNPLRVRFLNTSQPKSSRKRGNQKINMSNLSSKADRVKINKDQFYKAAGDQHLNQKSKEREVCFGMNAKKPLFEMHLDSGNYDILNKDQVISKFAQLNTKCMKKPLIEVQLDSKKFHILNKEQVFDKVIKSNTKKAGIMGSMVEAAGINHRKPCPCNRCVCASHHIIGEATKGKKRSTKAKSKKGKDDEHHKPKMSKQEYKELGERLKEYMDIDNIRMKKRRKLDKKLEKSIDKDASAGVLLAENLIDFGRLGIRSATDVMRNIGRYASDPVYTYQTMRAIQDNPRLLGSMLKSKSECPGLKATMRRVRLRCFAMRGMKKLEEKLDSNPVTRYLVYSGQGSKSKRKKIRPKRRVRERHDPDCNFYMASLRKRPFLSVYRMFPSFYPHFLSLVHAWKQFMDILLFILAAIVWSPCILCMELCRACMCCFLCTG